MLLLLNDIAHFESGLMPSNGGSILSAGGLAPSEVIILTGGFNILSEAGIMPSEVAGRRISGAVFVLEAVSYISEA